jgi:hypothetical protein
MSFAVSRVNDVATATVTAASEASGYPVANVKKAAQPFQGYMTLAAGAGQSITIDSGSATTVGVVALIRTNFVTATFQADDAPTFNSAAGSPQYAATITCAEALNGRYHGSHRPSSVVARRYKRILIASQTPVATEPILAHPAGTSHYLVGALWIGALVTVPRDIRMDPHLERPEPVDDLVLPSGVRQRSVMGYTPLQLTASRMAEQDAGGLDAELRAWLAFDEAWRRVDYALVMPRALVPSDAYVMRRLTGPSWTWAKTWSEGDLALEEVLG